MLSVDRNKKIIENDDILRKIVYSIDKAIVEDVPKYLRNSHLETNNGVGLIKGDYINTNLRNHVISEGIDLVPFKRFAWSGRIVVDRMGHVTYSIMTEETLGGIPKKKNRERPHYLQTVLYVENRECIAKYEQMTLQDLGITIFDEDVFRPDFETISQGMIDKSEDYRHYIVVYQAENREIKNVKLKLLDKDFNIVDEVSLMKYIKPDFARLTDIEINEKSGEENVGDKKRLLAVKKGLQPQLREIEKQA